MIHFRRTDEPFATEGVERWQVEYFDEDEGTMFPVGLAFVVVVGRAAQLNFIIVGDQWRRRGIATAIVQSCRGRWDKLTFTSAMGNEGAALLRSIGE